METAEEPPETEDLFREPEGYYEAEKPATLVEYTSPQGRSYRLRLVGHNPLWGHLLWNAGRVVTEYLEQNAAPLVRGNTVLELGAGAGLPSLSCVRLGARRVVVTDYPDQDLIDNLAINIESNCPAESREVIIAEGFLWGSDVRQLTNHLPTPSDGFHVLILADLLFNHSEHEKLASTVSALLDHGQGSRALVFFTAYRPWLLEKDLHFFEIAHEKGLIVRPVLEKKLNKVMFEQDPGDEALRRTVFGYELMWPGQNTV